MSLWAEDGGVAISTYETIKLVKPPQTIKIDMLIVDEAHYAKNHSAKA
jgi:superfamily II DNA or RNA helicase